MAFFALKQEEKDGALLYLLRDVIKVPKMENASLANTNQKKKAGKQKRKKNNNKKSKNDDDNNADDDNDDGDESYMPTGRGNADKQTIIFVATKHHVEYVANLLTNAGYALSYIYGSLDQVARRQQIEQFRRGFTNLLVVTDVAARGIDIPILENVINYDFVDGSKVFVHRVGRAARAGRRGWAYSLISPDEVSAIYLFNNIDIVVYSFLFAMCASYHILLIYIYFLLDHLKWENYQIHQHRTMQVKLYLAHCHDPYLKTILSGRVVNC
jgi:ATP-dependent RNA helicase DDX54/DBP10